MKPASLVELPVQGFELITVSWMTILKIFLRISSLLLAKGQQHNGDGKRKTQV